MKGKIAVVASGRVQSELVKALNEKGAYCEEIGLIDYNFAKEYLKKFEAVVLPFPSQKDKIEALAESEWKISDLLSDKHLMIGGMICDEIKKELEYNNIKYCDFFENNAYVMKNAYLTTQGVLRLLFDHADRFIVGKTALVTGFGRIARSLALSLKNLGLKVYVAARSEIHLAEASSMGFDVFEISKIKGKTFYFDFIFNTVPWHVFDSNDVSHIKPEALYFEIASSPYGCEKEGFNLYGKKYIRAASLPGKFYPASVAENIADFILNIREE